VRVIRSTENFVVGRTLRSPASGLFRRRANGPPLQLHFKGFKGDGYLKHRARQVQQLVLRLAQSKLGVRRLGCGKSFPNERQGVPIQATVCGKGIKTFSSKDDVRKRLGILGWMSRRGIVGIGWQAEPERCAELVE
jgi:hypothetical protein